MTRTHHWLIAILMTSTLVCLGIIFTLLGQSPAQLSTPAQPLSVQAQPNTPNTAPMVVPVSTKSQAIGADIAKQKAQQLLPIDTIESVQKVNYEGKLAYQVNTNQNTLYLNASTAEVIAMTPRLDNKLNNQPSVVKVDYEQPRYQEREEHEEHDEEHEHDDD